MVEAAAVLVMLALLAEVVEDETFEVVEGVTFDVVAGLEVGVSPRLGRPWKTLGDVTAAVVGVEGVGVATGAALEGAETVFTEDVVPVVTLGAVCPVGPAEPVCPAVGAGVMIAGSEALTEVREVGVAEGVQFEACWLASFASASCLRDPYLYRSKSDIEITPSLSTSISRKRS